MAANPQPTRRVRRNIGRSLVLALLPCLAVGVGLPACRWHLDCKEAEVETDKLLTEFGSCTGDESCQVFFIGPRLEDANEQGGTCIDQLLCSVAIRGDADPEAMVSRARDIVSRRQCNTCAIAKCRHPDGLQAACDPDTHHCKLAPK